MKNSQTLTRADFEAAAAAAKGRETTALYADVGLQPGPNRWMLAVDGVRLPLRLFVAMALESKGLAGERPGTDAAFALAEGAGLTPYDGHAAEGPLRTG
jgi:hypothetical protein